MVKEKTRIGLAQLTVTDGYRSQNINLRTHMYLRTLEHLHSETVMLLNLEMQPQLLKEQIIRR